MLKAILGFIGGKQTNIFNKKGRVQHDLGDKKWEDWNNRLKADPDYDFRNHSGNKGPTDHKPQKSS